MLAGHPQEDSYQPNTIRNKDARPFHTAARTNNYISTPIIISPTPLFACANADIKERTDVNGSLPEAQQIIRQESHASLSLSRRVTMRKRSVSSCTPEKNGRNNESRPHKELNAKPGARTRTARQHTLIRKKALELPQHSSHTIVDLLRKKGRHRRREK